MKSHFKLLKTAIDDNVAIVVDQQGLDKDSVHPTQKPVALMEYLIKTYSNEGETVLDNCMGSGTTGVACVNTNRKFIGIEMDEQYYKIAKERIESAVPVEEVVQHASNPLVDALY